MKRTVDVNAWALVAGARPIACPSLRSQEIAFAAARRGTMGVFGTTRPGSGRLTT